MFAKSTGFKGYLFFLVDVNWSSLSVMSPPIKLVPKISLNGP